MNDGPVFYLFTSRFNSAYQLLTFDGHFDAVIPPSLLELRHERGLTVVPLHKGIWDTGSGYEIFAGEEKALCCIEGLTLRCDKEIVRGGSRIDLMERVGHPQP